MKPRFTWASAVALVLTVTCQIVTIMGATNGVILISTRKAQDLTYGTDANDQKGPGQVSQGDVAMQELLGDNGYSCRLVLDAQLGDATVNDSYLRPADTNFAPVLIIVSGSSGSKPRRNSAEPLMDSDPVVSP